MNELSEFFQNFGKDNPNFDQNNYHNSEDYSVHNDVYLNDNIENLSDQSIIDEIESVTEVLSDHELSCIRCGAHTFNLIVTDQTSGTKCKETAEKIAQIIEIVKSYRKTEHKETFLLNQQRFPPIPNTTRWNVHYSLMKILKDNQTFFDRIAVNSPALSKLSYFSLTVDQISV